MPRHARQAVAGLAGPARVTTTLDLPLQFALERLASEQLRRLPERASLALLVMDADTRQIRAIVSGGEGVNEARAGALDLTRAVRSPGSAMKPFIYAMAFEDGIAGPETRVEDLPHHFGAYAPEDFDRGFAGGVTAGEALRRSLNLPAVALLDQIGPAQFAARLRLAGVALHLPAGAEPSLPLALGGAGITLRDLTGLYAALATDGSAGGPRLLPELTARGGPFLQTRAAETIASVLTQPFPDSSLPGIAWKTGTSWGGRDSWALGFDRAHVVGVWVGRPDGTPLPGATGRGLALPLLARVFEVLPSMPRDAPAVVEAGHCRRGLIVERIAVAVPSAKRGSKRRRSGHVTGHGRTTAVDVPGERRASGDRSRASRGFLASTHARVLSIDGAGCRRRGGTGQLAREIAHMTRIADVPKRGAKTWQHGAA